MGIFPLINHDSSEVAVRLLQFTQINGIINMVHGALANENGDLSWTNYIWNRIQYKYSEANYIDKWKERVFSCKCPKVSYYMTNLSALTQPQPALTIENCPSSWNDPLFQILIYCIFLIVHMYIYIYNWVYIYIYVMCMYIYIYVWW